MLTFKLETSENYFSEGSLSRMAGVGKCETTPDNDWMDEPRDPRVIQTKLAPDCNEIRKTSIYI